MVKKTKKIEVPCVHATDSSKVSKASQNTSMVKASTETRALPIIATKPLFLAREAAASYLSVSLSMLEKLVQSGDAPKPRKLSAGRTGWLVSELDVWGYSRPISDLLPPSNSGYGRAGKPDSSNFPK